MISRKCVYFDAVQNKMDSRNMLIKFKSSE